MSEDRGMMKWMPYRSLNEQEKFLSAMRREKAKRQKPLLSEEEAEEINRLLCEYHGQEIVLTYWEDGFLFELQGFLNKISAEGHYLILNDVKIDFRVLTSLREK